jgi:CubicO group peptidase (beta-lactamase class C family)
MNPLTRFHRFLLLGMAAILAAGCSAAPPAASTDSPQATIRAPFSPTPALPAAPTAAAPAVPAVPIETDDGWQISTPEEQGLDSETLAELFPAIAAPGTNLHSLIVIRNGAIVLEAYFPPHDADRIHVVFSVTKSFIATLVGIAMDRGYFASLDQPIVDFLPGATFANPDPRKAQVTLEHVLTMTSGLGWEETDPTFTALYNSQDWIEYVLGLPLEAAPGSRFHYCSGCSHILSAALQETTGANTLDFAQENLFGPLGIKDPYWETDRNGIPIGGWGLFLTPRDMAKLGSLYLNQGRWNGEQIVPAAWVAAAVQKQVETGEALDYGYQWWVYPDYGAYAALGLGGQTVFVVPEQQLIVVTTADIAGHGPIFDLIEDFILPAVKSSGPLPANPAGDARLHELVAAAAAP